MSELEANANAEVFLVTVKHLAAENDKIRHELKRSQGIRNRLRNLVLELNSTIVGTFNQEPKPIVLLEKFFIDQGLLKAGDLTTFANAPEKEKVR